MFKKRIFVVIPVVKSILIFVLANIILYFAYRLWFGYSGFTGFFSDTINAGVVNELDSGDISLLVNFVDITVFDGSKVRRIYTPFGSDGHFSDVLGIFYYISSDYSSGGIWDYHVYDELGRSLKLSYGFAMLSTIFIDYFGLDQSILSGVYRFDSIYIVPNGYGHLVLYFVDYNIYQSFSVYNIDFYTKILNMIYNNVSYTFERLYAVSPALGLMLATAQPYVAFLFPNPTAVVSSTINNIYTYRDNFRVVRYHPSHIIEYTSLLNINRSVISDFYSSFAAALSIIYRDMQNIYSLDSYMHPIFLHSYFYNEDTEKWHFYFDYVHQNIPILFSDEFAGRVMQNHAIEVLTLNNGVVSYRRLNVHLEGKGEVLQVAGNFSYILNGDLAVLTKVYDYAY